MIMQFDCPCSAISPGHGFSLLHMLCHRLIRAGQSDGLGETLRGPPGEIMAEYTGGDPFREPVSILCFFDFCGSGTQVSEGNKFPDISPNIKQQEYISKIHVHLQLYQRPLHGSAEY